MIMKDGDVAGEIRARLSFAALKPEKVLNGNKIVWSWRFPRCLERQRHLLFAPEVFPSQLKRVFCPIIEQLVGTI